MLLTEYARVPPGSGQALGPGPHGERAARFHSTLITGRGGCGSLPHASLPPGNGAGYRRADSTSRRSQPGAPGCWWPTPRGQQPSSRPQGGHRSAVLAQEERNFTTASLGPGHHQVISLRLEVMFAAFAFSSTAAVMMHPLAP